MQPAIATIALLMFAVVAAAQTPTHQWGPDTTSTGSNTGVGIVLPGLDCAPSPTLPGVIACSGYLSSDLDQTMLDVTVWVPDDGAPAHPLVVGIHGWGGSKDGNKKYAARMTGAGFTFLSYSTRGFGNSFGYANLADVNVEGADLRSMIGQVVDDSRLRVDGRAVGVFGASYGGAHSFIAALRPNFTSPDGRPVTIRTVAPLATWTELTGALRFNGRRYEPITPAGAFKLSFIEGLYLGGCENPPLCTNYPEYLKLWNAWIAVTEPNNITPLDRQIVDGFSGYRSVYWQQDFWNAVAQHRIPIYLAQGWTDDLFPVGETLRIYETLKAIDPNYPVALYFGDVGHPRARNKPEEVDFVIDQVVDWARWFLKSEGVQPALDVQSAITRSKTTPFNPADVVRVPTYDDLTTDEITYSFAKSQVPQFLTFNPANVGGATWDPFVMLGSEELEYFPQDVPSVFVPGDVAVYEVPVAELSGGAPLLLAGEPAITFTINQVAPTGYRVQLNVRMFELRPDGSKTIITRGTYTVESDNPPLPVNRETVTIPTYGNMYELQPDGILRLEITNVDSPYIAPSKVPSVSLVTKVKMRLPIRQ
jgi:predicted acyl esterase